MTNKKSVFKKIFSLPKHNGALKGKTEFYSVKDYTFSYGFGKSKKISTKGLIATVDHGATQNTYASKGAVGVGAIAGTVIAGPLAGLAGGLIGASRRKGGTKLYFAVRDAEGRTIVSEEFTAKEEEAVRKFVDAFNNSALDPKNGEED